MKFSQAFFRCIVCQLALALALLLAPLHGAHADITAGLEAYNARDYPTALAKLTVEAEAGDRIAQNLVGSLYARGLGVAPNDSVALKWFQLSAENGYALAQTNLGAMYENGRGVPQDIGAARFWYQKAALQGEERAQVYLRSLNQQSAFALANGSQGSAASAQAQALQLAKQYMGLRPDLFQARTELRSVPLVKNPAEFPEMVKFTVYSLRQAPDWDPTNPEWQRIYLIVRKDYNRLFNEAANDPQLSAMAQDLEQAFLQSLTERLSLAQLKELVSHYASPVSRKFMAIRLAMKDEMALGLLEFMRRTAFPSQATPAIPPRDANETLILVDLFDEVRRIQAALMPQAPNSLVADEIQLRFDTINALWKSLPEDERAVILGWRAGPVSAAERDALTKAAEKIPRTIDVARQDKLLAQRFAEFAQRWQAEIKP